MKGKAISFLVYNRFTFGDQIVSQFVVFECKWLFSIIFFYFHKSNGSQDRFHTHAFNAISLKLFGQYDEYILINEESGEYAIRTRKNIIQYFPRDSYHKIGNGTGCMTILFSGPWKKTWKEYINGTVVYYNWNRHVNKKI
jgi:hypothetical protein